MKIEEYILLCTAEEAIEVATEATILQESVTDTVVWTTFIEKTKVQPNIIVPLVAEINDLVGCLELLSEYNVFDHDPFDKEMIDKKFKTLEESAVDFLPPLILSCLEMQKSISKLLRFGLDHNHPVTNTPSIDNLYCNVNNFIACMDYCKINHLALQCLFDRDAISLKKAKVKMYLKKAQDAGIVENYIAC